MITDINCTVDIPVYNCLISTLAVARLYVVLKLWVTLLLDDCILLTNSQGYLNVDLSVLE